jgi:hypothetical protein
LRYSIPVKTFENRLKREINLAPGITNERFRYYKRAEK